MRAAAVLNTLPPYRGKQKILVHNQSTKNIIDELIKAHHLYVNDYKKIAKYFEGKNDLETAKNVFNFLKKNVKYVVDSEENQKIKSPGAIIKTGVCDCKCYSLFIGGILGAMKIPFVYRFASYNNSKNPGHVFIVMYYYTKEIFIDPVLEKFNEKKKYTYKIDKMITSISGIGKPARKIAVKKVQVKKPLINPIPFTTAPVNTMTVNTMPAKPKKGLKKVLVKVAAVPARNAFLLLLKLNFKNLAVKINNALIKDEPGVKKIWDSVGGKFDSLKKAVEVGSRKAPVENLPDSEAIGAITAAAAIAAAAPIILKVTSFLNSVGIDSAKIKQVASQQLVKKVNQVKAKVEAIKAQKQDPNNLKLAPKPVLSPVQVNEEPVFNDEKSVTLEEVTVTADKKKNNTLLYAAAAVAAVFLISRK
jgi:hypothetical protein